MIRRCMVLEHHAPPDRCERLIFHMAASDSTTPSFKRCNRGDDCIHPNGCWQPATTEYFSRHSSKPDGLRSCCKLCQRKYQQQYYSEHLEEQAQYRDNNREKRRAHSRQYYKDNRESESARASRYLDSNPERFCAASQRRRARLLAADATFTEQQWLKCLEHFNHRCAYCGQSQETCHVLQREHVIPLLEGGGYMAGNIVPACKSCNSSKRNTPVHEWLVRKFGDQEAKQILAHIESYFNTLKEMSAHGNQHTS